MTATNQADRSPAPGIIPDPVHIRDDPARPAPANGKTASAHARRRNPVRVAADAMMSALRGDKYMVDAYPAAEQQDAAAPDGSVASGTSRKSADNPAREH